METNFNFKSQICTSREQSERLLALGLKKETADMFIGINWGNELAYDNNGGYTGNLDTIIPAWSLHRLWELANIKHMILDSEDEIAVLYDGVIMKIEQFIKEGYFNKEYLV